MRSTWSAFVTAPTFADEDRTRNAYLAYIFILSTLGLNILSIVIAYLFSPFSFDISVHLITALVQIVLLALVRQGYIRLAVIIFAVSGWLLVTESAYRVDGLINPIIAWYAIPILFTGLLVGVRAGLVSLFLCMITVLAFAVSAEAGGQIATGTRLGYYVTLFGFAAVTVYLSAGAINKALARVRASETELRERNLQLQSEREKRQHIQSELDEIQETIRLSDQGYRTLFENNPNPMWVFERGSLHFVAINDAAIALYGYSRDEFLSMTIRDIRPPEELTRLEETIHGPLPVFAEPELWLHRTRDGRILQVEITGHETVFQGKSARLILIRDMTTQKETEESLRTSQELFNRVFDTVPVGVSVSHIDDGLYVSVNPHLAAMLEFRREDMIGRSSSELKIIDSAVYAKHVDQMKTKYPSPSAFKVETKLKTRTGRSVDALTSMQQVKIGGKDALLSIIMDITAIKRTERERLQIEILQSELDKQREVVELKESFISRVSHEFRSPLAIMLTGTGILRMHDAKFTSEQRSERLAKIETQIHYLSNLLDNILTIGKARAGKFQFNPHTMDIVNFCRELFEDFRLTDNNIHPFRFEAAGDLSNARMDDKLLQHILMNLISNAVKYSPAGKQVNLHMERDDADVVIEISDQGIGIPEEEQSQVFEPFFRSKNAESIKGTGLGLAITKESVDAHRGSISWRSKPGSGTTFTVRLPGGFQPVLMLEPEM